jgi:hypothetical protein
VLPERTRREPQGRKYVNRNGESKHILYREWQCMKARCRKSRSYLRRGITVCAEWANDYESFKQYVSSLPNYDPDRIGLGRNKFTLDRIDNNKGYEPGNVRWATPVQQFWNSSTAMQIKKFQK